MTRPDSTMLVMIQGEERVVSVEMEGTDLTHIEFFELIEMILTKSAYSKHEIESYVLQWAEDIRLSKEN